MAKICCYYLRPHPNTYGLDNYHHVGIINQTKTNFTKARVAVASNNNTF